MILNNTQANIFKVNGGIADNFANRPAASGSFYIFYSIDTQEIYYDNGAWILIGSGGGGGGVNIYNSDGTLTGNRILNGANNQLQFQNLSYFTTINGIDLDIHNGNYSFGDSVAKNFLYFTTNYTDIRTDSGLFKTSYQGNNIGLKLDFQNNQFFYGDYQNLTSGLSLRIYLPNEIYLTDQSLHGLAYYKNLLTTVIGDTNATNNGTFLTIDDTNQIIKTSGGNNDIGLKLDFANSKYVLGDEPNGLGFVYDALNQLYYFGDYGQNGNFIEYNSSTGIVTSNFGFANQGLRFEMSNSVYQFGQITGGNTTGFYINDTNQFISVLNQNVTNGINLNFNLRSYIFGQQNSFNETQFIIDDVNQVSQTKNKNNITGFRLDFNSNNFKFGQIIGGNALHLAIDDTNGVFAGDYQGNINGLLLNYANKNYIFGNLLGNNTYLQVEGTFEQFNILNRNVYQGIKIDFINSTYKYGHLTGNNLTQLYINDNSQLLYTGNKNNIGNGLYCDFSSNVYQFGRAIGGNQTYLTIDDAQVYPVSLRGTNITSGTAGGASGQHLKIKINGVDYKIELKNP